MRKKKIHSIENKCEILYIFQPKIWRDLSFDEWLNELQTHKDRMLK